MPYDGDVMQDYLTGAFLRLKQKLTIVSGRMLTDSEEAEDVLQDSFLRLWRRHYPLRSEKEAEALLARTVRNVSLNQRRKRRPVPLETDPADEGSDNEEKERAYAELKQKIDNELSPTQRYILEEKELGGRTLEEIAKELKMEPAAVRKQLSRARMTLRNSLNHE